LLLWVWLLLWLLQQQLLLEEGRQGRRAVFLVWVERRHDRTQSWWVVVGKRLQEDWMRIGRVSQSATAQVAPVLD